MSKPLPFHFDILEKTIELFDKNVVISSFSLAQVLSLLANGASGETHKELIHGLVENDQDISYLNKQFTDLNKKLTDGDAEVKIANSVWVRRGMALNEDFRKIGEEYYHATVSNLETEQKVNEWVAKSTNNLIKTIIKQLDPETILMLINAVYFNGKWTSSFDPEETFEETFHTFAGKSQPIQFMHHSSTNFPLLRAGVYNAVTKDYGKSFEAVFVLPNQKEKKAVFDTIEEIKKTGDAFNSKKYKQEKLDFSVPKFTLEFDEILNECLMKCNINKAFNPEAEIDKLASDRLSVSKVIHKTFIEFTEEGTKAAAVSAVSVSRSATAKKLFSFNMNRPFLLFIKHKETNTLLFSGLIQSLL